MKKAISLIGLLMTLAIPSGLLAQQAGYSQTNLVSNTAGVATTTDPQLLNPWGISILPGQDFWIANNNSGTSTLYDTPGQQGCRAGGDHTRGNTQSERQLQPWLSHGQRVQRQRLLTSAAGQFIFDTEDGLIASWTGASNTATVAFDNSASGAVYKGLASAQQHLPVGGEFQ